MFEAAPPMEQEDEWMRYGDLERRVLDRFVSKPDLTEVAVDTSHTLLLDYLRKRGLLK